jgi:hypothetical protein
VGRGAVDAALASGGAAMSLARTLVLIGAALVALGLLLQLAPQ